MKRLLGTNRIIEENRAINGGSGFLKLALIFIAVYFVGTQLSQLIPGLVQTVYFMSTDEVREYIASGNADVSELYAMLYSIKMPFWITALSLTARIGLIAAVVFYCVKFEHRRAFGMGFIKDNAVIEYLVGFAIGAVMFSCVFGICVLSGEVKINGLNPNVSIPALLTLLIGFVIQSAAEEILMRSYFMVSVSRCKGGVPFAIIANSLVFAALHLGNNGMTPLAFINITLFGVFASIYFLRRGSIWGIAAVHAAWNFTQGNIFGVAVSGIDAGSALLSSSFFGGAFSGGAFGPEGGLGATMVLLIGIAALLPMKNRELTPPPFAVKGIFYSV